MKPGTEAIILGILSLTVSVFTLIILAKGRNNGLRENLYNRQLDIFQDLYSKLISLESSFRDYLQLTKSSVDNTISDFEINIVDQELVVLDNQIDNLLNELEFSLDNAQLLLPDEIAIVFDNFMIEFYKLETTYNRQNLKNEDISKFSSRIFELEDGIRKFIGLEKLIKENRTLL